MVNILSNFNFAMHYVKIDLGLSFEQTTMGLKSPNDKLQETEALGF